MTERSARFDMPFIMPGQAQKEMFHNEALAIADVLLHPVVTGAAVTQPPAMPEPGQCWIVAAAASGVFAGREGQIAAWTSGGWRFVVPIEGMSVWDLAAGLWRIWGSGGWSDGRLPASALWIGGQQVVGARLAGVPSPSGGTTIDAEARAAVNAVIVALRTHGLID